MLVVTLQRPLGLIFPAMQLSLFAYNEVPTIAVAKDCWFWARR
jgi:hypothetical protein